MMKLFRVEGGTASFGPGSLLALDAAQLCARAAYVEVVEAPGEGQPSPVDRHVVRVAVMQQFKAGEVLGVEVPLLKYLADRLVLVGAAGAGMEDDPSASPPVPPKPRRR